MTSKPHHSLDTERPANRVNLTKFDKKAEAEALKDNMQAKKKERRPLPKGEEAYLGASLSLTNARRHLRVAKHLGDERLFGSASSHVVLALEELSKAWLLMILALGIDVPKDLLADILSKHLPRHGMTFGFLFGAMINSMVGRAAIRVQRRHKVKTFPPELRDEFINELRREFDSLVSGSSKNDFKDLLHWTGSIIELKNRGFYVDFDGKDWVHPRSVSQNTFSTGHQIATGLIRLLGPTIQKVCKFRVESDAELKALFNAQIERGEESDPEKFLANLILTAVGQVSNTKSANPVSRD